MASGAHSASVLPHVQTPITYTGSNGYKSCTVAVALFIDLPVAWVPDAPHGPYLDLGVSTWGAIQEAGHWIICKCLLLPYGPAPLGSSFEWMATPPGHLSEWPCFVSDLQLVCLLRFMLMIVSVASQLPPGLGFSFLLPFRTAIGRFRPRSRRNWKLNDYICHQDLVCRVMTMDEYQK